MQQNHPAPRAPRPLPLFLDLVRLASVEQPELAAAALQGLRRYERAERLPEPRQRAEIARIGPATLRDCGGSGAPLVLVPSLINPPEILDLDSEVSLASALSADRQVLLVDWGPASGRRDLGIGGHVAELMVPLLHHLGERVSLVGYCLGGTMAIAAANLVPVECIATIAAPWRFTAYPAASREQLGKIWAGSTAASAQLGGLPMEVLQGAFWSLDPQRTVAKFARLAGYSGGSDDERRFVTLEDWANEGEPLPVPAARELIEGFFQADVPGSGRWRVSGRFISGDLPCPSLHILAGHDRIVPAATAPAGRRHQLNAGHVGMVVGSARSELHAILNDFLAAGHAHR